MICERCHGQRHSHHQQAQLARAQVAPQRAPAQSEKSEVHGGATLAQITRPAGLQGYRCRALQSRCGRSGSARAGLV